MFAWPGVGHESDAARAGPRSDRGVFGFTRERFDANLIAVVAVVDIRGEFRGARVIRTA